MFGGLTGGFSGESWRKGKSLTVILSRVGVFFGDILKDGFSF